jgi:phosphate transport system permease protein
MAGRLHRFMFRQGDPMIWLAGSGLGICLLMIGGLLVLVGAKGLDIFWPRELIRIRTSDGRVVLGEVLGREKAAEKEEATKAAGDRIRVKIGNRDLNGLDYRWIDESAIVSRDVPPDALLLERQEYGNFHGFLKQILKGGEPVPAGPGGVLAAFRELQGVIRPAVERLAEEERRDVGRINTRLEKERLELKKREKETGPAAEALRAESAKRTADLKVRYEELRARLETERAALLENRVVVTDAAGKDKELPLADVVRIVTPNALSTAGKVGVYLARVWEFVSGEPRESNTEGGIFPAIFGTVLMVILMSLVAVPFGVVTALYLREYAAQGRLVRLVRIAVNNLAGVPSIVFGIFGLGFFVYGIGVHVDQLLFSAALPTPTYGTGGILWCALTLALLTVPVVVVASEEALAAVPRGMREASLALGATKWQTTWRVVLPAAAPGILTGLILAMARGTGEVAPLMIVGVVKSAPVLPLDGIAPFLHLDRKIMHLGFHIYDVGFQSPNVEAALPMVYATTALLLGVVVALNLTAILVRNHLRKKLQSSTF